jgi:hypothetical protein
VPAALLAAVSAPVEARWGHMPAYSSLDSRQIWRHRSACRAPGTSSPHTQLHAWLMCGCVASRNALQATAVWATDWMEGASLARATRAPATHRGTHIVSGVSGSAIATVGAPSRGCPVRRPPHPRHLLLHSPVLCTEGQQQGLIVVVPRLSNVLCVVPLHIHT